ncbi:MAG TPA: hypothetical protein DCQ36_09820, partial [Actinobacteria bacterium]|nr:hypothetical protein [Actinomycetota bacterium]
GEPVRTNLGWAVLVSILCFLPLGLVAVVYGLRSRRALGAGDPGGARALGRVARRWVIGTLVVGVLIDAALVAVLALLGAFSS